MQDHEIFAATWSQAEAEWEGGPLVQDSALSLSDGSRVSALVCNFVLPSESADDEYQGGVR